LRNIFATIWIIASGGKRKLYLHLAVADQVNVLVQRIRYV